MVVVKEKVQFFIGCIAPYNKIWPEICYELNDYIVNCIGPIRDVWAPTNKWSAPDSYLKEMGSSLSTVMIVLDKIDHDIELVNIKRSTIAAENMLCRQGRRVFNLNPGYLNNEGLFLASYKPKHIRTRIAYDVWLEKQLHWSENTLVPMINTFSEYSDPERILSFNRLREEIMHYCVHQEHNDSNKMLLSKVV